MSDNASVTGNTVFTPTGSVFGLTLYVKGGGVSVGGGTFTKTGGVIAGYPTSLDGYLHRIAPDSHTADHANRDDCNVATSDGHALYSESDALTIGDVTKQAFNDNLDENMNTP
jgi:hypothetical protein